MIYLEPNTLGWRPHLVSWMATLPGTLTAQHRTIVEDMFEYFVPPLLNFIRRAGIKVCGRGRCRGGAGRGGGGEGRSFRMVKVY